MVPLRNRIFLCLVLTVVFSVMIVGCSMTSDVDPDTQTTGPSTDAQSTDMPKQEDNNARPYFDPVAFAEQIPEALQQKMLDAYLRDVYWQYEQNPEIIQEMSLRVFGIFEDAYVFYADGPFIYLDYIRYEEVNGVKIWHPNSQEMVVYYHEVIFRLQEALDQGILSEDDFIVLCDHYYGAYPDREKTEGPDNHPKDHSADVLAFYLEFWEVFSNCRQDGYRQYCHFENQALYEELMAKAKQDLLYYEIVRMERLSDELWVFEFFNQTIKRPDGIYQVHYVGNVDGEYRVFLNKDQIPAEIADGVTIPEFEPYGPDYISPGDIVGGI